MSKGIYLTLMIGPGVPVPVPQTVLEALTNVGFFAQPLEMVHEGNEAEQHLISNRIRRVCHDSTREVS